MTSSTDSIYGVLPESWKLVSLNNLIENKQANLQTGPFGTMLHASAYKATGIPVVAVKNIGDNQVVHSNIPFVNDETFQRLKRYELMVGDILFGRKGSIDRRAFIRSEETGWLQGSDCIRLRFYDSQINASFISYVLGTRQYVEWITQNAQGATMPSLNQEILGRIPIPLPPIPEQRAIAEVLSSLDDKIELNRQMNATLESLARVVFNSWFVESGDAKGWKVGSILEFADLLSGGTPNTQVSEYWNGDIKWVSAKDVGNAQGTFVLNTERKITRAGIEHSSTKILPDLTTIVTARGTVGSYCILGESMAMNQTNYGLKAKENNTDYFVFFSLANLVAQLRQAAYGTIFDTVTTRTFEASEVVVPPTSEMVKFNQQVQPLMEMILSNMQQSCTLAVLRDALLPRLMSGEIRVKDL